MARAAESAAGCGAPRHARHDSARLSARVRRCAAGRVPQLPQLRRADAWSLLIQSESASRSGLAAHCRPAAEGLTGNRRAYAPVGTKPERPS
jgi:hypothetical protein